MNLNRKWTNRFYYYLFSYIFLVITLLSFVSYVVYQSFITTLSNEIETSTVLSMSKIKDDMDTRIDEMNRIALQISSDSSLTPYKVSEDAYAPFRTVTELKKYQSSNLFINDIVLFYNCISCTTMYATSGTYDANDFFSQLYNFQNWSNEQFINTLPTMVAPVMRPLEQVKIIGQPTHISTYIYPISNNSSKPYGAVMFLIEERTLNQLIQNALGDKQGQLFIINGRDIIVNHSNGESDKNATYVQEWIKTHSLTPPISEVKINKYKYTVINVKSNLNGWSYITVMPSEQVMKKVDRSRSLFNWTISAVFLLGVVIAISFSTRNYRPLRKLMTAIRNDQHSPLTDLSSKSNEIEVISNYVSYKNKEYDSLKSKLQSQARIVREQLIIKLIKGNAHEYEQQDTSAAISSLHLDKSHFIVLLFLIHKSKQFTQQYHQSMQEIINFSLINCTEELSLELGIGYGAELTDDQGIVILLNMDENCAKPELVKDLVAKVKSFFKQEFSLTLTVSVGDICSEFSDIHQSFLQAKQAMRYRFIKGRDQVICYSDLHNIQNSGNWYPHELETNLLKSIKQGNGHEVEKIIRDTMDNLAIRRMSLEVVQFICFTIVNTMMKALNEMKIETDQGIEQTLEELYIPRFETIEEMECFIIDFCSNVCNRIVNKKESKNFTLLENMKEYIERNFRDNTIDLNRIAEAFDISASYATRFFKDHTDYSIMRYIDQLRMDESKKLICTTNLTLNEIMNEVGYVDPTNFIRKFKKIEGVTPIEYRKSIVGL
jgi:two-component system response regulator YesN